MGFRAQFARQPFRAAHVRFGSKADMTHLGGHLHRRSVVRWMANILKVLLVLHQLRWLRTKGS
jgi:hypothetical protein